MLGMKAEGVLGMMVEDVERRTDWYAAECQ